MRRLVLAAVASGLLSGCLVRPWAIEESDRIDRLMEYEVDDAEDEALEGICSPRGLSPIAEAAEHAFRARPAEAPRKKAAKGSKRQASFSSLAPNTGKASKRR